MSFKHGSNWPWPKLPFIEIRAAPAIGRALHMLEVHSAEEEKLTYLVHWPI